MSDSSTDYQKRLTKQTESYDPDKGTSHPLPKVKKSVQSPSYAPRSSKRAKKYKKQLDEATGW